MFDPLVKFARLAAGWHMRTHEDSYAPFLAGCGYAGLTVTQVRAGEGGR